MKVLIIIPPKDFRDETVGLAKLLLGKWGLSPVIASYITASKECIGYHGAAYKIDINPTNLTSQGFDAMLLVDGPGVETYKLYDFRPLLDLVKDFSTNNKIVAAIGNSIKVLARANVIANRKVAAESDEESKRLVRIYRGSESGSDVESDRNLLTAKGYEQAEL